MQLELHTDGYHKHRDAIKKELGEHPRGWVQFNGKARSRWRILCQIYHDSEEGRKFIRQTSLDPDVQL